MRVSTILPCALLLAGATTAGGQIPIRTIGPILATSVENVGAAISVRGTSDGHVIVGAAGRQRVYAFDSTLQRFTVVVDSGASTGTIAIRTTGLIPYIADSTLLADFSANALLVLDPAGKQVRSMAPPHAADLVFLGIPASFGQPGFDPKGRLIYRIQVRPDFRPQPTESGNQRLNMTPVNADSAPILRGDFDTRTVDTVAWMNTPSQARMAIDVKVNPAGGPPTITMHILVNPFQLADEWALLSDGTIAIVRLHDYHIDWVDPDGSRRSSPKMQIDWRRYTDAEKQARVDSIRKIVEDQVRRNVAAEAGVTLAQQMKMDIGIVPDSEFPSFWPPVRSGSLIPDHDAHLWILPTTSVSAANGLTYDVVDRTGKVLERVQLPKGHVLVGFGPRNTVYLSKADGTNTYLERALIR